MKKFQPSVFLALCAVLILYLLFPTTNSTIDAYGYAAGIKYGKDLFQPFHLLYNIVGYGLYRLLNIFAAVDVLAMMKCLNAVAAVYCLYLLCKILTYLTANQWQRLLLVLLTAFSFGVWRFATENENYILPIVFSLLGSLYYLKYLNNSSGKHLALAGFFAAIACLFHVIHIFWWLGLLVGLLARKTKFKIALFYFLPSLFCPVVYLIVIWAVQPCFSISCIWSFFGVILGGSSVDFSIGLDNFKLGFISLFRTFYQVHGNILVLFRHAPVSVIAAIIAVILALCSVWLLLKKRLLKIQKPANFIATHAIILVLQLLFAFCSKGNAEFMIMLPFLLAIIINSVIRFDKTFVSLLCASLLVWNMSLAILPSHYAVFNKHEKLLTMITNHKGDIFLLEDHYVLENQLFYQTGGDDTISIRGIPQNALLMKALMENASKTGKSVFTDYYGKPRVMDRYEMTIKTDFNFMKDYKFLKTDSFMNFYGKNYICKILPTNQP